MEPPPTPRPPAPKVPSTVSQWRASARGCHVLTKNPSKLECLHPGSKVTFKEYLSMRIIRRVSNITEFPDRETEGRAKEMVKGDEAIQTWLSYIETDQYPTDRKLGMFALVRQGQLAIVASDSQEPSQTVELRRRDRPQAPELSADTAGRSPSAAASTAPTEPSTAASSVPTELSTAASRKWVKYARADGEPQVNQFVINLLNALTLSVGQGVNCQWSPNGNLFGSVSFGEVQLTAYVDGYLVGVKKSDIFAIVEVKAGIRDPEQYPLVEWQEGAEMVSWIMNDEENLRRHPFETRLLISLNRHEMYLTLARYHEDYVKFLKGEFQGLKSYPENRFLHLHEYGPWDIGKKSHMRDLAEIIVGFSLRVKDEQARSAVPSGSGPDGA
ncbi:hypothetical protein E8E15_006696 [Penicillium rubens]|uniref:uncharacterized protein n=1 Tax=Penicillium rubens TaxID=1108849 RepID=UPI001D4168E2|nr:uncharacterized protein N7525_000573 [Penicillium rubens]KAF3020435.1 hypothetical protein E8E15_006696 [Penicillium rubens]KAJ5039693.1 hypothetical protein NUH16_009479 [Penicillium rubens]KAJ5842832.1 hypothetical protein N7525_000573 [Penicillium rubens]KAJ5846591.1 hypothetical protein N7534_010260 [Penicillium rubens]